MEKELLLKKTDLLGIAYVLLYAGIVFFFPFAMEGGRLAWTGFLFSDSIKELAGLKNFGNVVEAFPYISGFLKVGFLATFGEMLKVRGKTGSWKTSSIFPKFIVWGLYGALFTLVFALFAKGVAALMGTPILPFHLENEYAQRFLFAFTTSFCMNMIFCYPMMLSHEWFNMVISKKRFIGGADFLKSIDSHIWGSFMLKTIVVFWIPAHTVTFCLPPNYRVLMSAVLSLALGFILTVKPKKKDPAPQAAAV